MYVFYVPMIKTYTKMRLMYCIKSIITVECVTTTLEFGTSFFVTFLPYWGYM